MCWADWTKGQTCSPGTIYLQENENYILKWFKLFASIGRAEEDLFASEDNFHCPIYFSRQQDALAHNWPANLEGRTLSCKQKEWFGFPTPSYLAPRQEPLQLPTSVTNTILKARVWRRVLLISYNQRKHSHLCIKLSNYYNRVSAWV